MIRVGGLVVVVSMAARTGIRSSSIVAFMAIGTRYRNMCSGQYIIGIMSREKSRFPSGISGMACFAIS